MATSVWQLGLGVALVVGLMVAFRQVDRWIYGHTPRRRLVPRRRPIRLPIRSRRFPEPVHRPVQTVAADLRRLSRQLVLVPAGAPLVRWRALWSAYDAVLIEAAELLDVPHELAETTMGPAHDLERLRLVAALEGAGLVVRGD